MYLKIQVYRGSIPGLVHVSVSKALYHESLPVAESMVYECDTIVNRFQLN